MTWDSRTERGHGHNAHPQGEAEANRRAFTSVGLIAALALFLASPLPPELVPAALESFLMYGAIGAIALAIFRRQPVRANYLTAWDQALMLLFLSQLAGLFVDPEAVNEFVEAHQLSR